MTPDHKTDTDRRLSLLKEKILTDRLFRTFLIAGTTSGYNLIYGIFNGIMGIVYQSAWFGIMFFYYALIGIMRLSVVSYQAGKKENRSARVVMRHNGVALIFLAIILSISVAISFLFPVTKKYNKVVMVLIATYTFFITALAVRNIVSAHKKKSSVLIVLRNISLAGAVASMLSLQRSMTLTFGEGPEGEVFGHIMNGATGLGAFIIVLFLGIVTIVRSRHINDSES